MVNIFTPKPLPRPMTPISKHRGAKHPDTDELTKYQRRAATKRARASRRTNRGSR